MTHFDDIYQRVRLLNNHLRDAGSPGSEIRLAVHRQLWEIVRDLNRRLSLGLANTDVDLDFDEEFLRIHFWCGEGGQAETEVTIRIDRMFHVTHEEKDLKTGRVTIS